MNTLFLFLYIKKVSNLHCAILARHHPYEKISCDFCPKNIQLKIRRFCMIYRAINVLNSAINHTEITRRKHLIFLIKNRPIFVKFNSLENNMNKIKLFIDCQQILKLLL